MRIAVFSDLHLGFSTSERGDESFNAARSAFELALANGVELVLLAGDIFDAAIPSQETLLGAFVIFSEFAEKMKAKDNALELTRTPREGGKAELLALPPIISIHGTHEFRGKDYANVLQLLEHAGFLIYLHTQKIAVKKGGETVVVQGMGGVPEKKALDALHALAPEPEKGAVNIFLLHQSIKEFLPFEDDMVATLSLSSLPQGFDIVINGHLHWHSTERLQQGGTLLMPGSTITTQMKKLESEKGKGIFIFDTGEGAKAEAESGKGAKERTARFLPLPNQRRFFYHKVEFTNSAAEDVLQKANALVEKDLAHVAGASSPTLPPLIRLKLCGTLASGVSNSDVQLGALDETFRGRAILSISREFETAGFKKKIAELREMQHSKKSVAAMGIEILEKNLSETGFNNAFDARRIFTLLAEGETEKVAELLSGKGKDNP
ncbi:MAG: DNA repair exonuclease [Candidatus Diapherotrites archaeon]